MASDLHIVPHLLLRRTKSLRHALDTVLVTVDVHDGHARDFTDFPLEVSVASRNDVTSVLLASLQEAVISVGAFMCTWQSFEARVLCKAQCEPVFATKLLQFGHDTVGDARDALGQKAIHHTAVHLELVLDAEVNKIGIY